MYWQNWQVSAGFGQTAFATQLVQWTEIDTGEHDDVISTTGDANDPLAYFAGMRMRLWKGDEQYLQIKNNLLRNTDIIKL